MVKFWKIQIEKAINKTKAKIIFCEKNGIGDTAMKEKARLKKQQRQLEDIDK